MPRYDACVVGAGPAAAMAAMCLVSGGAKVALIARPDRGFAAATSRWETIQPSAALLMSKHGLKGLLESFSNRRVANSLSSWGSSKIVERGAILSPYGGSWIIDRRDADKKLLERLYPRGVDVYCAEVVAVDRLGPAWILGSRPEDTPVIVADFFVDAGGIGSPFARSIAARRRALDKLVSISLLLEDDGPEDLTLRLDAHKDGWAMTLRGATERLFCFFTDGDLLGRPCDDRLREMIERNISECPAVGAVCRRYDIRRAGTCFVRTAVTTTLDRACGPNWFACGDAASSFDPLSSQGFVSALESGALAAQKIIDIVNGLHGAWQDYEHLRRTRFAEYLRHRAAIYGLEQRWKSEAFWARRSLKHTTQLREQRLGLA